MKHIYHFLLVSLLSAAAVYAQNQTPAPQSVSTTAVAGAKAPTSDTERAPAFRANKDQILAAQRMLKTKGIYTGDATGKLDPTTRASIKSFQKENGLRATGSLNRATLEKMGIELTEKQRAIPISESSYAKPRKSKAAKTSKAVSLTGDDKPRRAVFRATKEQVIEAQKLLRAGGMYAGDESGKLDDPTRDGLKKYQEANGLKVTGTLNQLTLEKMGIALTDKQRSVDGSQ